MSSIPALSPVAVIGRIEPPDDQLTFGGEFFTFEHGGATHTAKVSRSTPRTGRVVPGFYGELGRWYLADPCTMILHQAMNSARQDETQKQAADRIARREAKAKLQAEEAAEKAKKPRRRSW